MGPSVEYVAKETANNVRRNLLMASASVLCMAVSLMLVGAVLLIKQGVANATIQWRNGVDMSIFMNIDATPDQNKAVAGQLAASPDVKRFHYVNQDDAYREFKRMYGNSPDIVESVTANVLPPSYRVVPRRPELIGQIGDRFKNEPGVKEVVYGKDAIDALLRITRIAQYTILFLAGVFLVSAALLILNTIRMAIFSRRREVAVMKLVGATNWFIRVPFMLEGLLQGLVGGLIAFLAVYIGRDLISNLIGNNQLFRQLVVSPGEAVGTGIFLTVVGALVGGVGSGLAVTRFLDV